MRIVSSLTPLNCRADEVLQSHQVLLSLPVALERRAGLVFLGFLDSLGFLGYQENIRNNANYPVSGRGHFQGLRLELFPCVKALVSGHLRENQQPPYSILFLSINYFTLPFVTMILQ